jgi:hypothetical protein
MSLRSLNKDNQKSIKDSMKSVSTSSKKADKLRKSKKESDNENKLIAVQREKSDFQCYEFCLRYSTQKLNTNITSVYIICDSVMGKRIDFISKKKSKDYVNVKLKTKKASKEKLAIIQEYDATNETESDGSKMLDFKKDAVLTEDKLENRESKNVRFQTNPEYKEATLDSMSKSLLIYKLDTLFMNLFQVNFLL